MQISAENRSGRLVIEAENVSYSYGKKNIVRNLSTTIQRGDKIGIVGPNGSGKTTLLRILMGELQPSQGEVRHGTNVEMAYLINCVRKSVKASLFWIPGQNDTITINGKRQLWAISRIFFSRATGSGRRSARFQAVSAIASFWRAYLRSLPIC
jgi:ATP-binding cassette subfamily F protein uup